MNFEHVSQKAADNIRGMYDLVQEIKITLKTVKRNNARAIDTETGSIRRREAIARYDLCVRLERLISKFEEDFK